MVMLLVMETMLTAVTLGGTQEAVLEVRGRGAEGKPVYEGGKVEFLDVSLADQLVHFAGGDELPLRLSVRYRVLETAPVLLNSRMGTEYWHLYHYGSDRMTALYTVEDIDLSTPGEATVSVEQGTIGTRYGGGIDKGLVGLRGHYYFLVDQPNREWLDVVHPPAFFDDEALARKLTFTLANLASFTLHFDSVESTWEAGGLLRVRLSVTDADGDQYPVVNVSAQARAGEWQTPLETQCDTVGVPSGWLQCRLPAAGAPSEISVFATVSTMTPKGPQLVEVTRTIVRGEGQRTPEQMRALPETPPIPRNAEGVLRETRALWVNPRSFADQKSADQLVERAARARLNVLIPDIFVRNDFYAKSELMPMARSVKEEGFDPLGYLIEQAHAAGLEVHPWFCVTYRDVAFRATLPGVDILTDKGEAESVGADVHRPAYRDFIVKLMVGVARDYEVDGIHLDYIRSMSDCFCPACRAEFAQQFGKPLTEASEEEWIAWHRQAIADIVQRTAEGTRAVRPKAMLSAAVFANLQSGARQGQDPAGWVRKGWLDVIIPMDYSMQTLAVRSNERQFLDALDNDDKLVTGLSLYMRSGEVVLSREPELVRQQITLVRSMGIHGYCLFEGQYLSDQIVDMLAADLNTEIAVPYFR
ncbi:MAG: glycoside hydrolase family 10 protein [Candidatus Zipacnadales bacterium]